MSLSLKVPPLLLLGGFAGAMAVLARLDGDLLVLPALVPVSLVAVAGVFLLPAVAGFLRAGTTVDPRTPGRSQQLVTTGLYRISRNPMYVAFVLLLLAWALLLGSVLALLAVPVYAVWLHVWQILPEEGALARLFGEQYTAYCRETRRWL